MEKEAKQDEAAWRDREWQEAAAEEAEMVHHPQYIESRWKSYINDGAGVVYGEPRVDASYEENKRTTPATPNYKDCQFTQGYEEYFDHTSPYHSRQPDDVGVTGGSHIKTRPRVRFTDAERHRAMIIPPDFPPTQRPRFTTPYLNSVNAMWVGTKFADSPSGQ